MRTTECRQKIIERSLIGDIEGCELEGCFQPFRVEEVICANTKVEQVTGGDTRRIVVVIFRTGRGDNEASRPVIARARANSVNDSGDLAAAKEANVRLLSRCERQSIGKASNSAGYFTTVKAPRERCPRAIFFVLISQKCSLLKGLIVIDAEHSCAEWRIENNSAGFRAEESSARVAKRCVGLESMQIGSGDPS